MDKRLIKKQLYDKCISIQLSRVKNIENTMEEAQNSANEYGPQSDLFDSHIMQLIGNRDMYAQQLEVEMNLLETLNKLDITIQHESAAFGSVIVTDMQKVFVSIGLGKIQIENDVYYAISLQVPFYQALKGLKKGDEFDFRGKKIKILDVF
ncbi:MAG: hypothetical protein JW731_03960 [Bacteroidales bacterium]|nr:hypothetical protein [Bacteroidales bacterium]